MNNNSRRDFIKRVGSAAALSAVFSGAYYYADKYGFKRASQNKLPVIPDFSIKNYDSSLPSVVVCKGSDPEKLIDSLLEKLGGINNFIKANDRVIIKPNVAWDRVPQMGATTNPQLISRIIQKVKEAGAKEIIVTDVTCNSPERCFDHSGIKNATLSAGGKIFIPADNDFVTVNMNGVLLKDWPVVNLFLKADKVINIAPVKQHSHSMLTCGMKNWYGIIGGRRNMLHQDIHNSIVDLASAVIPTLTIIDATKILVKNGPQGGGMDDVKSGIGIAGGIDQVALDSFAAEQLGLKPEMIPYLKIGQEKGLGKIVYRNNRFTEVEVI